MVREVHFKLTGQFWKILKPWELTILHHDWFRHLEQDIHILHIVRQGGMVHYPPRREAPGQLIAGGFGVGDTDVMLLGGQARKATPTRSPGLLDAKFNRLKKVKC